MEQRKKRNMFKQLNNFFAKKINFYKAKQIDPKFVEHLANVYQFAHFAKSQNNHELATISAHYLFDVLDWLRTEKSIEEEQQIKSFFDNIGDGFTKPNNITQMEKYAEQYFIYN